MSMWDPQITALSDAFRVIRYDARGHGASDVFPGDYSLDRLARDVIELLDELQVKRAHFCGLSLGGMVGQWLGIHAPERIQRLILCNTAAYMPPPASWDARIALVASEGMVAVADLVLARWFTSGFLGSGNPAIAQACSMLIKTAPFGYSRCCAAIRDMDMRRLLPLVQRPTLILAGQEDRATPLNQSKELAAVIPRATLAVLPAAHLSNIEVPEMFTETVLNFLQVNKRWPESFDYQTQSQN